MVAFNRHEDATGIDDPRIENLHNFAAVLNSSRQEMAKTIEQQEWRIRYLRGELWRSRFRSMLIDCGLMIIGAVACYLCQLVYLARPF